MEKIKVFLILAVIFLMFIPSERVEYDGAYTYTSSAGRDLKMLESVVMINIFVNVSDGMILVGNATGFSIAYDKKDNISYILTNNHVCLMENGMFMTYSRSDDELFGIINTYERRMDHAFVDSDNDLCILKVFDKIPPVKFGSAKKMDPMTTLYTIGAPNGIFPIWIDLKLSGFIERELFAPEFKNNDDRILLLSGIIVGGQSGSPVYDTSGNVVGIIFGKTAQRYGGLAVPSESIIDFVKRSGL